MSWGWRGLVSHLLVRKLAITLVFCFVFTFIVLCKVMKLLFHVKNNIHPKCKSLPIWRFKQDSRWFSQKCQECVYSMWFPHCFMYNNVVSQSSQNSQENELCTEILYPKNLLAEFREEYGHAFTKLRYTDYLPGTVPVTVNILLTFRSSPLYDICYSINLYKIHCLSTDRMNRSLRKMCTSKKLKLIWILL